MFLVVYAWIAAFVGNFGFGMLPAIDGPRAGSLGSAVLLEVLLIAACGVRFTEPGIERAAA